MRKAKGPGAKLHPATIIASVVFGLMAIGCYVRLYISVGLLGVQDEMHWVGSAFSSSIGGTPFVNDLYIQQLCGLLYEPLVFMYYKLFGSTGILLFVRHLYFALAASTAFIFYRYFRPKVDAPLALAIAALPLVGCFWGQPSLGYNAIGSLCFGAGALLSFRGLEENSRVDLALAGVYFFFVCAAYPTMAGAVAVLWIFICAARLYLRKPFVKELLLVAGVCSGLLTIFLSSLILRAGLDNVLFSYTFSTAQSSLGSFTDKFYYGGMLFWQFLPSLWLLLPAFFIWFALWKTKNLSWYVLAAALCLLTAFHEPPEPGPFQPTLYFLLAIAGLPLVVAAWRSGFAKSWPELVLLAAALVASIFPWWSSALTLYVTFVTSTYALAPLFVFARDPKLSPWISLVALVVPLTIFIPKNVLGQLDDSQSEYAVKMMTDGPYAGLFTSPGRAGYLNQLKADIDAARDQAKSILFYDEFPLGYMMTDLYPATPALFMHGLRESYAVKPFFRNYYKDPSKRPDLIVRFKYFEIGGNKISVHPDQYPPQYKDVFWNYLPEESGEYSLILDRDSYSIFKRNVLR